MKKTTGTVLKIATLVLGVAGMVISNIKDEKDKQEMIDQVKNDVLSEISKEK